MSQRFYEGVNVACSGVVPYRGNELSEQHDVDPRRWFFILRPPDLMRRALTQFNGAPVLSTHKPTLGVDSSGLAEPPHRRDRHARQV